MKTTGTTKGITKAKEAIRGGGTHAKAVRPMVPDDVNAMRQYPTWSPGQLRPFVPQHDFKTNPGNALCGGPGASVGGKLNGIKDRNSMRQTSVMNKVGK